MQRILEPGEIETLDASALPRIRLPERASVFASRAQRLRTLAPGNAISGYLLLMAALVDAQQQVLDGLPPAKIPEDSLKLAIAHGMPVVPAVGSALDAHWRETLTMLIARIRDGVRRDASVSSAAPMIIQQLDRLSSLADDEVDALATAVLERDLDRVDIALAPIVHAALQIEWTRLACAQSVNALPYLDIPGLCPSCGSPPVASIVRVGGVHDGYRYLQCSLCSTEFHHVRVKCSHCDSTKGIAYHTIEDSPPGTRAESCDACHSYVKIFAQDKLLDADPFADDLAALTLDLMMNEAGYHRPHPHPFLWPATTGETDA